MNTNKTVIAVIATLLIVSVSLSIACSKEKIQKPTPQEQQEDNIDPKISSTKERFIQAVCAIHNACNVAYNEHAEELIAACNENDTNAFFSITGINPSMVKDACMMSDTIYQNFIDCNPNYVFSDDICGTCTASPLSQLGLQLDLSHGNLPASMPDCTFLFEDFAGCYHGCRMAHIYQNINYFTCLDICLGLVFGIVEINY